MKIAMYGSGAAGSVFAAYLRAGGADIILIDRYKEHMEKVAHDGLILTIHDMIDGKYVDTTKKLTGFRTYLSAEEAEKAEGKIDIIIYMTKATQLRNAIICSLPICGGHTVAVSLINGLGNDDNLMNFFSKDRCVIGSGVLGTALPEPGHCVSTPAGTVHMNFGAIERSKESDTACRYLLDCFSKGGCNAFWRSDDIYDYVWRKVIVNATLNTVCAVTRLTCGEVDNNQWGRQLYFGVIREACAVAHERGIEIDPQEFIRIDYPALIRDLYDYYPSMAQDMLMHHCPTEIDVLNGKIAQYGKEYGIPTPTCDILTKIVHCIQDNYANQYLK